MHFSWTFKSFAQAFSKACGFQRQSLWWVLRAKPLSGEPPQPRRVIARQVSLVVYMGGLFTRRTKLPLSWHIYLRHLKFRSSLFKGLRIPKAEPLVGFKGEALNILCPHNLVFYLVNIYKIQSKKLLKIYNKKFKKVL